MTQSSSSVLGPDCFSHTLQQWSVDPHWRRLKIKCRPSILVHFGNENYFFWHITPIRAEMFLFMGWRMGNSFTGQLDISWIIIPKWTNGVISESTLGEKTKTNQVLSSWLKPDIAYCSLLCLIELHICPQIIIKTPVSHLPFYTINAHTVVNFESVHINCNTTVNTCKLNKSWIKTTLNKCSIYSC